MFGYNANEDKLTATEAAAVKDFKIYAERMGLETEGRALLQRAAETPKSNKSSGSASLIIGRNGDNMAKISLSYTECEVLGKMVNAAIDELPFGSRDDFAMLYDILGKLGEPAAIHFNKWTDRLERLRSTKLSMPVCSTNKSDNDSSYVRG